MSDACAVGLVGCGRWGVNILRDLVALGCDVFVADVDPRVVSTARALGARAVVDEVEALPDVEGIVVATSSTTHAAVVQRALVRDVPVFVEKPIVLDLDTLVHLTSTNAPVFEMHKWRYHPGIELLAAIVASGELGAVRSLSTARIGSIDEHYDVDPVWVLAPHDLSIILHILGAIPQSRAARATVADGTATGLVGVLGDAPWCTIVVAGDSPIWRREVQLCCEGGTAVLPAPDAPAVSIRRRDSGAALTMRALPSDQPLLREVTAFVSHLRGGPAPRSSLDDSVAIMQALVALRALAGLDA